MDARLQFLDSPLAGSADRDPAAHQLSRQVAP